MGKGRIAQFKKNLGLEKQNRVKKHMRKINVGGTIDTVPYKIQVEQNKFTQNYISQHKMWIL